jgi:hypothetical protein
VVEEKVEAQHDLRKVIKVQMKVNLHPENPQLFFFSSLVLSILEVELSDTKVHEP